ncbi:hypothetical protein Hanom_Chr02g00177261 [Helianthus anomalus]
MFNLEFCFNLCRLLREVLCVLTVHIHASLKLHGVGKSIAILVVNLRMGT